MFKLRYFKNKVKQSINCPDCQQTNDLKHYTSEFILLRPDDKENIIEFESLFKSVQKKELKDFRCNFCNVLHISLVLDYEYLFDNTFLILKLNTIFNNVYTNLDIHGFDPDLILIPRDRKNIRWKLKSALFYYPTQRDYLKPGGHYVCYVRNHTNGWLKISDNDVTEQKDFKKDLNGAYMLFLEKD